MYTIDRKELLETRKMVEEFAIAGHPRLAAIRAPLPCDGPNFFSRIAAQSEPCERPYVEERIAA